MRTDKILEFTNYYLTTGGLTDKRLIRLLTLLKISFINGEEARVLLKKRTNELENVRAKLESTRKELATLAIEYEKLDKRNNLLRRALMILARKTSIFDPQHRPAENWRDWAIEEAKKVS